MAVLAAVNYVDKLVLLEDGRELAITNFYRACSNHSDLGPLTARDKLCSCCRWPDHVGAEVFTVEVPGADAALIFTVDAIESIDPENNPNRYN